MTTLIERKRNPGHEGAPAMVRPTPVAPPRTGANCIDVPAMQIDVPTMQRVPVSDHDLPVLAAQEEPHPPQRPDWASLLDDGVQPALILGAERRSSGRR